jgi:hypothetical protein
MSVILTDGVVPKLTPAQIKLRNISYRPNSARRKSQKSGPVTVLISSKNYTTA